jgi:hypothetical protein
MAAVGEIGPKARWGEIIAAQHIAARNAVMECYAQLLPDQADVAAVSPARCTGRYSMTRNSISERWRDDFVLEAKQLAPAPSSVDPISP